MPLWESVSDQGNGPSENVWFLFFPSSFFKYLAHAFTQSSYHCSQQSRLSRHYQIKWTWTFVLWQKLSQSGPYMLKGTAGIYFLSIAELASAHSLAHGSPRKNKLHAPTVFPVEAFFIAKSKSIAYVLVNLKSAITVSNPWLQPSHIFNLPTFIYIRDAIEGRPSFTVTHSQLKEQTKVQTKNKEICQKIRGNTVI